MTKICISLLGSCNVRGQLGESFCFRLRKTKLLLIYLAMQEGRPTSREKLANLFWCDHPSVQARASLRQVLSELRKLLQKSSSSPLQMDGSDVLLVSSRVDVDAIRFLRLSNEEEESSLQRASDLYRGQFMDGVDLSCHAFDEWIDLERRKFHQIAVQTVRRLTDLKSRKGHGASAIESAKRLVDLEPLDEAAHRKLMTLQAAEGQFHASLQQFALCKDLLRSELDVDPQPETTELEREIRRDRQLQNADERSDSGNLHLLNRHSVLRPSPAQIANHKNRSHESSRRFRDRRAYSVMLKILAPVSLALALAGPYTSYSFGIWPKPSATVDAGTESSRGKNVENGGISPPANQSGSANTSSAPKTHSINPSATEAYNQGVRMLDMQTPRSLEIAIARFEQAIELEPEYPRAEAALANAYAHGHMMQWDQALGLGWAGLGLSKSVELAEQALVEDNQTALAQTVLAKAEFFGQQRNDRYTNAIAKAQQAFLLDPVDPDAYMGLGQIFIYGGEPERALAHLHLARELESSSSGEAEYLLSLANFHLERFSEAVRFAELALKKSPEAYHVWALLAASQGYLGNNGEAILAINHARSLIQKQRSRHISAAAMPGFRSYVDPIDQARLRRGLDIACALIGAE